MSLILTDKYNNYLSNYQILKRTIMALNFCYPEQKINRQTILHCLNDKQFLSKYVLYGRSTKISRVDVND
jgi:hypothetical protein